MKLPSSVLGAILLGIAVQTTGCQKEEVEPQSKNKKEETNNKPTSEKVPDNCPACGMG